MCVFTLLESKLPQFKAFEIIKAAGMEVLAALYVIGKHAMILVQHVFCRIGCGFVGLEVVIENLLCR